MRSLFRADCMVRSHSMRQSFYQQGFASLIVPSGKYSIVEGKFTEVQSPEKYKGRYFETESDFLTQILVDEG